MNQKGFANIALITLTVVVVAVLGYVVLMKSTSAPISEQQIGTQSQQPTPSQTNTPQATSGKVIFPTKSDILKVGQTYVVKWESPQKYLGQQISEVRLEPVGYPDSAWGLVNQKANLTNEGKATVIIPGLLADVPGFTFPGMYTISVFTTSGQLGVEGLGITSEQFQIINLKIYSEKDFSFEYPSTFQFDEGRFYLCEGKTVGGVDSPRRCELEYDLRVYKQKALDYPVSAYETFTLKTKSEKSYSGWKKETDSTYERFIEIVLKIGDGSYVKMSFAGSGFISNYDNLELTTLGTEILSSFQTK